MYWRTLERLIAGIFLMAIGVLVAQADDLMSPAMPAAEVKARLGTPQAPLMVDLRTPPEFAIAHLPGAVNIPVSELEKRLDEARPAEGHELLIYCLNGSRTRQAEPLLYAAWLRALQKRLLEDDLGGPLAAEFSHIDPVVLGTMLRRLVESHGGNEKGLSAYLSTHPATDERIEALSHSTDQ